MYHIVLLNCAVPLIFLSFLKSFLYFPSLSIRHMYKPLQIIFLCILSSFVHSNLLDLH